MYIIIFMQAAARVLAKPSLRGNPVRGTNCISQMYIINLYAGGSTGSGKAIPSGKSRTRYQLYQPNVYNYLYAGGSTGSGKAIPSGKSRTRYKPYFQGNTKIPLEFEIWILEFIRWSS